MRTFLQLFMLIGVISFSQFRIEAQEVWSQFKFQEMYLYGQINEPLDPGTKVFREVFPNIEEDVNNVARRVISSLYKSASDPIPKVTTLYYTVYPDGALSAKSGVVPNIKISLNSEYIAEYYERTKSIEKCREELIGVLSHELTHAFQLEPKGCGSYGSDPVFTSFIEGIADANRYLCGDHTWSKPSPGGHYLDGYTCTGFFLVYLQDKYDPEFIKKWNMTANELPVWSYDAAIKLVLGEQYDIDSLWQEYQKSLGATGPKDDLPKKYLEVNLSTAGGLCDKVDTNQKREITDLKITGVINAKDFQFMRDEMRSLTVLDIKNTRIEACNENVLNTPYGWTNKADYIPESALEYHPYLKTIHLPSGLKGISMMAFKRAKNLTGTITIPASVSEICSVAFEEDILITTFVCEGTGPPVLKTDFLNYRPFHGIYPMTMTLRVPKGSLSAYRMAEGWKDFKVIEEYDNTATSNTKVINSEGMASVISSSGIVSIHSPRTFTLVELFDLNGHLLKKQTYQLVNDAVFEFNHLNNQIGIIQISYPGGCKESFKIYLQ